MSSSAVIHTVEGHVRKLSINEGVYGAGSDYWDALVVEQIGDLSLSFLAYERSWRDLPIKLRIVCDEITRILRDPNFRGHFIVDFSREVVRINYFPEPGLRQTTYLSFNIRKFAENYQLSDVYDYLKEFLIDYFREDNGSGLSRISRITKPSETIRKEMVSTFPSLTRIARYD